MTRETSERMKTIAATGIIAARKHTVLSRGAAEDQSGILTMCSWTSVPKNRTTRSPRCPLFIQGTSKRTVPVNHRTA